METKRGKVITFYSYKGGTGRSMALANVACFLSRRVDVNRGVLAIDWDLEAPGLHHFFRNTRPPLKVPGPDNSQTPKGVIELFHELNEPASHDDAGEPSSEDAAEKLVRQVPLSDYVVKTDISGVDLMPAGRFDQDYSERVSAFDWRRFFDCAPSLIRILAERLAEQYDYVLIDSRTGLNDISGICTALLPDQLVFVFTPNRQSLLGGIDVLKKAAVYRRQSDDLRPLTIFPLPSRVDVSEPQLLEKWRFGDPDDAESGAGYQGQFEDVFAEMYAMPSCSLKNYFDEVQVQYVPRYSYGEEIAAVIERGNRLSISRSYAAFTNILAEADPPWRTPRSTENRSASFAHLTPSSVKVQAAKDYLSEERFRLKLHDLVVQEVREVISQTADDSFPVQGRFSAQEFAVRLHQYEDVCSDLLRIQALIGFWGAPDHRGFLSLAPKRICDRLKQQSGSTAWLALRWYPGLLLLYSGGIAAVSANRYDNLRELMLTPVSGIDDSTGVGPTLIRVIAGAMNQLHDAFKVLPGHEKEYTPRSEYLYKFLQPLLDDVLFLSSDYESAFDRFEVLYALEHASRYSGASGSPWGPVGRFGWKAGLSGFSPLDRVVAEADSEGVSWPPIKAGLFGGSVDRFKEVVSSYSQSIARLNWG
jgi:cellulose biosynthesis protein BcsQ